MSDEQDKLRVSLEAPKLFGRKKKDAEDSAPAEDVVLAEQAVAPAPVEPETPEEPAVTAEEPAPTAVIPTVSAPQPEPEPEPEPEPVPEPEPEPVVATMAGPIAAEEPPPVVTPVAPAAPAKKPVAPASPAPKPHAATLPPTSPGKAASPGRAALVAGRLGALLKKPVEQADADAVPLLTPYRAAAVTGLVVGGAMVLLTWLALRGCEAVRGTSSCGGGPGFVLLLITFVVCVYLGSALLRAFVIPDPGSSSFLAVGLVAVVALLFLIDMIDSWAMIIVIPVLTIAAYLASVWVTETFVDTDSR